MKRARREFCGKSRVGAVGFVSFPLSMRRCSSFLFAVLLAGCAPGVKQTVTIGDGSAASGDILKVETFPTAIPSGVIETPDHGKEVGMAYGPIASISETPANGIANAHYLEDGATVIGMQVNIPPAEDGFFYEAWAVPSDGTAWKSLGHLRNSLNDARHGVRFETRENLKEITILRITMEADDGNPAPGTAVAEAKLKPTTR